MSNIKLFEDKKVRSLWDEKEEQCYFSVVDVIEVLTDSLDPKDYWNRMKKREKLSGFELSTICRQLKIEATDDKKYATDCSNTEGLLRIIQSIPSPKAEPLQFRNTMNQTKRDLMRFLVPRNDKLRGFSSRRFGMI